MNQKEALEIRFAMLRYRRRFLPKGKIVTGFVQGGNWQLARLISVVTNSTQSLCEEFQCSSSPRILVSYERNEKFDDAAKAKGTPVIFPSLFLGKYAVVYKTPMERTSRTLDPNKRDSLRQIIDDIGDSVRRGNFGGGFRD